MLVQTLPRKSCARPFVFAAAALLFGTTLGFSGAAAEHSFEQLEWRGIFALGEEPEFSIYDPVEERGFWLRCGKARDGIEVIQHDPLEKTLTVRLADRIRKLSLAGGGIAVMAPMVRLIPAPLDAAAEGNDEAGPNVPTVTLVPAEEPEEMSSKRGGGMAEAVEIELVKPAEDDEMLRQTNNADDRN